MIIDLKTNFAYKCPACFTFFEKQICVFEIPENGGVQVNCDCGFSFVSISRNNNSYNLTVPCFICGDEHKYKISKKSFWKNELLIHGCTLSNLDVCALGEDKHIKKWITEYSSMLDTIMENDFE